MSTSSNQEDKNQIDKPFDSAWKQALTHLPVARDLFEARLPAAIKKHIDLSTLEVKNKSYVDDDARHTHADMVFGMETARGQGYLYLLADQQKKPEKRLLVRLFSYILRIIDDHIKSTEDSYFPIVIPLVYYNGLQTPYPYPMDFWAYFENPRLAKALMTRPVDLIDINEIRDPVDKERLSALLELLLKYMRRKDDFVWVIRALRLSGNLTYTHEQGLTVYIENMLHFAMKEATISSSADFADEIEQAIPILGDTIMGLLEKEHHLGKLEGKLEGLQEGKLEGLQEGKLEGLQEGKLEGLQQVASSLLKLGQPPEFVAQATGLSLDNIQGLQTSLDHATSPML